MAQSFVNLLVKDNGFNATLKRAMSTFASLGNAANGAKGQFSKFADSISQVAQSQQMLNTALKGNPYGMLAQAATMAFTKIIEKATEATDAEKRAFEWQQQRAEMEQQAYEAIGKSTGELMAKYELLRVEWLNLSTDQQKNEWINKNKSAFQGLNLAVTDVTSAENVFVNNTSQVVAALKARAEAEAYAEMYKDQIKKNAMNKVNGKYNTQLITDPYYRPSEMEARLAGFTLANKHENFEYKMVDNADPRNPGKHREWTGRLSQLGLQRLNANRQLGAASLENADRMLADQWAAKMAQAQANANALQNNSLFGSTGGSGGRGGKGIPVQIKPVYVPEPGTPDYVKAMIADLQGQLGKTADAGVREGILLDIRALQDEYKSMTTFGGESIEDPFVEAISPLQQLNKELEELRKNLELSPNTEAYQSGLQKIADKEKEIAQFKGLKQNLNDTNKALEQQKTAYNLAGQAAQNFGTALQGIEDPAAKAAGQVTQAIASIALGFAMASSNANTAGTGWGWLAWLAAGMSAMATTIATVHSLTGFAQGGIVKGNSYSGDNVGPVMLDAGELVLNKAQQATLAQNLQGNGGGGMRVVGEIQGEKIVLVANRYFKRTGQGEIVTW